MLASPKDITAELSRWIIRQSPVHPDDLDVILRTARSKMESNDRYRTRGEPSVFPYVKFEGFKDFIGWLDPMLNSIPQYRDLNLSAVEKRAGVAVDDPARSQFSFTSRYDAPKPDHDFVDLDALIRNVARSLEREHRVVVGDAVEST